MAVLDSDQVAELVRAVEAGVDVARSGDLGDVVPVGGVVPGGSAAAGGRGVGVAGGLGLGEVDDSSQSVSGGAVATGVEVVLDAVQVVGDVVVGVEVVDGSADQAAAVGDPVVVPGAAAPAGAVGAGGAVGRGGDQFGRGVRA